MIMHIKARFDEFKESSHISRVSNDHILELYVGLDEKGRKCIVFHSHFEERNVKSTSAIEVRQYKTSGYKALSFSLVNDEMSGLFFKFCEDIVEQTSRLEKESEGYNTIVQRYYLWRKMFFSSKKKYLSEHEIMGLIGEILYMRNFLASKYGLEKALDCWSGQELTHKDFSFENGWTEVKAISNGATSVKISSLEQLESDIEGELSVFVLEKMSSEYSGINLNSLVIETADLFIDSGKKDQFISKVSMHGYEYCDYYDDFVYELCGIYR